MTEAPMKACDRRAFVRTMAGGIAGIAVGASCARGEQGTARAANGAAASSSGAAASPAAPPAAAGEPGVQLYTVRRAMQSDFEGTLARVAEIGYREVETAGYFGRSPADVRRVLDAVGLRAPAAHIGLQELETSADAVFDAAGVIGHTYVIVPWLGEDRRTADGYRRTAQELNGWGERAAARGLRIGYHNHDFELAPVGEETGLDILLRETDPDLVAFEMDLYWVRKGGGDALDFFARNPGRFHAVHVKDMDGSAEQRMVDVGDGVIDFAAIFARAEQGGIRHWFVEHDNPVDPLDSIRRSHAALVELLSG